jgi:hypothetical protein
VSRQRDELGHALTELEAHAPVDAPPRLLGQPSTRTRAGWPALAAGAATIAGAALIAIFVAPGLQDPTASTSATPRASATGAPRSTSPEVISPTPSPTSVPSGSPSPTAVPSPSATPAASLPPREDWIAFRLALEPAPDRVTAVVEARGRTFILGAGPRNQPAIWYSDDLETWRAATVPNPGMAPEGGELGGSIGTLVDAGDRLVALATLGFAAGSGPFGTMIYTSVDGTAWTPATTPPRTETALFDLARSASRLIAVGTGTWISDDAGLTWTASSTVEELGGKMRSVSARGNTILAAGERGLDELGGPPGLAWISTDQGVSWRSTEFGYAAYEAVIATDGTMLVRGSEDEARRTILWRSTDGGGTWGATDFGDCQCLRGIAETGSGFVASGMGPTDVFVSTDGTSWSLVPVPVTVSRFAWSSVHGLLALGDGIVVFGPHPFP